MTLTTWTETMMESVVRLETGARNAPCLQLPEPQVPLLGPGQRQDLCYPAAAPVLEWLESAGRSTISSSAHSASLILSILTAGPQS